MIVAILGSAFDPLHFAHAGLAILTLEAGFADEVWLVPSPARWDKSPLAPAHQRLQWAQIAAKALRELGFTVRASDAELAAGPYRGSYHFLKELQDTHAGVTFRMIVGFDAWKSIPSWRDPVAGIQNGHQLLEEFEFILARRGDDKDSLTPSFLHPFVLPTFEEEEALLQKALGSAPLANLSSTAIRASLARGVLEKGWTFDSILADLKNENPYKTDS